jgi:hypothetical protein
MLEAASLRRGATPIAVALLVFMAIVGVGAIAQTLPPATCQNIPTVEIDTNPDTPPAATQTVVLDEEVDWFRVLFDEAVLVGGATVTIDPTPGSPCLTDGDCQIFDAQDLVRWTGCETFCCPAPPEPCSFCCPLDRNCATDPYCIAGSAFFNGNTFQVTLTDPSASPNNRVRIEQVLSTTTVPRAT